MARHLKGSTLRRARSCRFSASLNVASYARRARASYCQATSAKTPNAIGTAKGIMAYKYNMREHHPTHGYAATREDAMAAFKKSWRRQ